MNRVANAELANALWLRNCAAGGRVLAHSNTFRHREIVDKFPQTLTNDDGSLRIDEVLPKSGPVAQLGARFHGMEEVIGSIPIRSTKYINTLAEPFANVWQQISNCRAAKPCQSSPSPSLKRHASAVLLSKFLSTNSPSPQEPRRQAENTLIVSPDNASRRAINQAVRQELQAPYDPSRLRRVSRDRAGVCNRRQNTIYGSE
jgi:hypothetical protein